MITIDVRFSLSYSAPAIASPLLSTAPPPPLPSMLGLPLVVGVGVDIIHVPRIVGMIARHATRIVRTNGGSMGAQRIAAEKFAQRILHEEELQRWKKQHNGGEMAEKSLAFLAKSWAVKEAAFKAISGVSHPRQLTWHDAFLTYTSRRPQLEYTRELQEAWRKSGGGGGGGHDAPPQLHLSISHDGEYVAAFVVAQRPAADD